MVLKTMLQITVLALSLIPALLAAEEPALARIVTGDALVAQCIAPVHITQIDGEEKQLPGMGFELEAGMHSMHGKARINPAYCEVHRELQPTYIPALEFMFESGRIYYVGLDYSPERREDWRIVVWKVEDMAAEE